MGFGSDYWYSFHYSDSRGYLIFCCQNVATRDVHIIDVRLAKIKFYIHSFDLLKDNSPSAVILPIVANQQVSSLVSECFSVAFP